MYHKILVAIDRSPIGEKVFETGLTLAKAPELVSAEVSLQDSQTKAEKFLVTKTVKVSQARLKAAQEWPLVGQN